MSMNTEGMQLNLIDGPDPDCQDYTNSAEVRYLVLQNPRCNGKRPFCQEPFKVATACLVAFCLLLLMVLVATNVQSKSLYVRDVTSGSAEAHMLNTNANVAALTSELEALREEKSELEKENETSQLKAKIAELEASASTPVQVTTQSSPGQVNGKDSCPSDWHYFSGSCYFISVGRDDWPDSQAFCKQRGGHLAIIHTPEEQTFIWDLLPRGHWNAYWIGISDEKVEDDWYWVDGTKLVGGFWEDGEPNNHDDYEDCCYIVKTEVLSRNATKSWYDAPCDTPRHWICEKETDVQTSAVTSSSAEAHMLNTNANVTALTSELEALREEKSELEKENETSQLKAKIAELEASASTPVQVTTQSSPGQVNGKDSCPSDWDYFSGSCYFISDDRDDWQESQAFCKQIGGHLAIIHTPEEQTFIWDLLPRGHWNAYWIGISDEKEEDDWYWVDGTKLVGGFWEDGEPNNHDDEDCCYIVKTEVLSRNATKSWYDAPCLSYQRWICEKETDASS